MSWIKIDDGMAEHPKISAAGPLASYLHFCAIQYANRARTDGFIPHRQVPMLANFEGIQVTVLTIEGTGEIAEDVTARRLAATLVAVGLWEPVDGGYQIHDYLDYQASAAAIDQYRAKDRARKADGFHSDSARNPNGSVADSAPIPPYKTKTKTKTYTKTKDEDEDEPGDVARARARAAAAAAPGRSLAKASGPDLAPLVDAFTAAGLPRPSFERGEGTAAQDLLRQFPAAVIVACWQDCVSGAYGDPYVQRELSFVFLAGGQRVANWQRWKAQPPPARNGLRAVGGRQENGTVEYAIQAILAGEPITAADFASRPALWAQIETGVEARRCAR